MKRRRSLNSSWESMSHYHLPSPQTALGMKVLETKKDRTYMLFRMVVTKYHCRLFNRWYINFQCKSFHTLIRVLKDTSWAIMCLVYSEYIQRYTYGAASCSIHVIPVALHAYSKFYSICSNSIGRHLGMCLTAISIAERYQCLMYKHYLNLD